MESWSIRIGANWFWTEMRMALTQLTWLDTASRLAPASLAAAKTAAAGWHCFLTATIFITTSLHLLLLLWVITIILLQKQAFIPEKGFLLFVSHEHNPPLVRLPQESEIWLNQKTFFWCSSCGVWRMLWEVSVLGFAHIWYYWLTIPRNWQNPNGSRG